MRGFECGVRKALKSSSVGTRNSVLAHGIQCFLSYIHPSDTWAPPKCHEGGFDHSLTRDVEGVLLPSMWEWGEIPVTPQITPYSAGFLLMQSSELLGLEWPSLHTAGSQS